MSLSKQVMDNEDESKEEVFGEVDKKLLSSIGSVPVVLLVRWRLSYVTSSLKHVKLGQFVKSHWFDEAGSIWRFVLYFCGDTPDRQDQLTVFLENKNNHDVHISFDVVPITEDIKELKEFASKIEEQLVLPGERTSASCLGDFKDMFDTLEKQKVIYCANPQQTNCHLKFKITIR